MKLAQLRKNTTEVHREVRDSHVPTVWNGSALYAALKENACEIYISSTPPKKASFSRQPSESYDPPFPGGQEASNNRTPPPFSWKKRSRADTHVQPHTHNHTHTHARICIQVH